MAAFFKDKRILNYLICACTLTRLFLPIKIKIILKKFPASPMPIMFCFSIFSIFNQRTKKNSLKKNSNEFIFGFFKWLFFYHVRINLIKF
jgi:cobalamin biosynthesis protein CobD/CbiB